MKSHVLSDNGDKALALSVGDVVMRINRYFRPAEVDTLWRSNEGEGKAGLDAGDNR